MKTKPEARPTIPPTTVNTAHQFGFVRMEDRVAPSSTPAKQVEAIVIDAKATRAQMLLEAEPASGWVN